MPVTPYLHFQGTCEEALHHYASALGAKAEIVMRHGDAPPGEGAAPPEFANRVMHGSLVGPDGPLFMASDTIHETVEPGSSVSLSFTEPDVEKAKLVFAKLSDGGETMMPLQPVFWGGEFGMLKDRYGMHWMISAGDAS